MKRNINHVMIFEVQAVDISDADNISDLFYNEQAAEQIEVNLIIPDTDPYFEYLVEIKIYDLSIIKSVDSRITNYCADYEEKEQK